MFAFFVADQTSIMRLFRILLIGLLISSVVSCKPSLCEPNAENQSCDFPKRIGYVNDYCNFLDAEEIQKLEQTIADFNAKTGTEIIIVVEDSKKSHSRKFHCPKGIAQEWKLGPPERFDDFLIVISKKRTYVDFAYGLKFNHKLTPEEHHYLLHNIILPAFKRKAYYDGLRQAVDYFIMCQADHSTDTTRP
jgi:uncharacterized protein